MYDIQQLNAVAREGQGARRGLHPVARGLIEVGCTVVVMYDANTFHPELCVNTPSGERRWFKYDEFGLKAATNLLERLDGTRRAERISQIIG